MEIKLINKKIISIFLILVFVITMAQFIFTITPVMAATTILPPGSTANDLQRAVDDSAPGDVIIISSDITLDLGIFIASEKDITIQSTAGNNWSLIRTQYSQFHFHIVGKLTLQNITIDGGSTGGQLYVNGGDIILNNDAIIQNCFSPDVGGGVSVHRGNLVMNGNSVVRNCYARVGGGGIYVSNGTLTMNDESSVRNCYLTSRTTSVGGGVNVFNSTFTMNNNSVITECLSNLDGGGVFTHESTFNMNSGSITQNTANRGGGIYVHSGETIIENAIISGNNAVISENIVEGNGGGIYVTNAGNLEITGSTSITDNSALNGNGGGIYTENKQYENLTTGNNTRVQ